MTAPPKPWEKQSAMNPQGRANIVAAELQRLMNNVQASGAVSGGLAINNPNSLGLGTSSNSLRNMGPPVPAAPRPLSRAQNANTNTSINRYSTTGGYGGLGYNAGYTGYGTSYPPRYGYGSPYSSYGGYGMGYGGGYPGYGGYSAYNQQGIESRFIQAAEESSRPAFESLQSVVHAFGSISMMMESTFFAIHSSFRAVLGVAENFGRMRGILSQIFSALTIFRAVRWAYLKFMQMLGLRPPGEAEKVWAEASSTLEAAINIKGEDEKRQSSWPIFMFLSLIMGGPYLIWKLVKSVQSSVGDNARDIANAAAAAAQLQDIRWTKGIGKFIYSKAEYTFHARQQEELGFHAGETLYFAPLDKQIFKTQGWVFAVRAKDAAGNHIVKRRVGIVPLNHFKTLYTYAPLGDDKDPSVPSTPGSAVSGQPSTSQVTNPTNPGVLTANTHVVGTQPQNDPSIQPAVLNADLAQPSAFTNDSAVMPMVVPQPTANATSQNDPSIQPAVLNADLSQPSLTNHNSAVMQPTANATLQNNLVLTNGNTTQSMPKPNEIIEDGQGMVISQPSTIVNAPEMHLIPENVRYAEYVADLNLTDLGPPIQTSTDNFVANNDLQLMESFNLATAAVNQDINKIPEYMKPNADAMLKCLIDEAKKVGTADGK